MSDPISSPDPAWFAAMEMLAEEVTEERAGVPASAVLVNFRDVNPWVGVLVGVGEVRWTKRRRRRRSPGCGGMASSLVVCCEC